ncbi:MAG: hypothetical protein ACE5E7_17545 [Anaerolineae bacterium]
MANKARESLEKRVQRAILREAFFRWESAVVISLALLLAAASSLDILPVLNTAGLWLLGGVVAEAALVYSSLTDPEFGRKVVADLLRHEFRPERLRDKKLQQQFNQALDYRSRIEKSIRERRNTLLKDELTETASQIDEWLENIYDLAQRIDRYRQEKRILMRDRARAEKRLQELQQKLAAETDEKVKQQIQRTIDGTQRQLHTLETLNSTIERAELQLENSLINLGTIYSQTMLIDAKDIDSGRARRLRQDITDEVTELSDVLLAMDDVYSAESSA